MDISIVLFLSLVVIVFLPPFGQRRARSLRKSSYATVQNWWCTFLTWTPSATKRHMNSSRQTTSQQQHLHRHCEEYKKKRKKKFTWRGNKNSAKIEKKGRSKEIGIRRRIRGKVEIFHSCYSHTHTTYIWIYWFRRPCHDGHIMFIDQYEGIYTEGAALCCFHFKL